MSSCRRARALALLLVCAACVGSRADPLPPLATATAIPAPPSTLPTRSPEPAESEAGAEGLRLAAPVEVADGEAVPVTTVTGDRGLLLTLQGDSPEQLVGISRVTDPSGTVRYWADLANEVVLVNELDTRVLADAGAIGLYVAAEPQESLPAGEWAVEVATNGGVVTARHAITHGPASGARRLDLVVWATTPEDVTGVADAWRAVMDPVLSPHGLSVGRLEVLTAGPAGAEHRSLGLDGLAGDIHQACDAAARATAPPARTAVVVLAEHIGEGASTAYRAPDGEIRGFAVATPGTPVLGPASHGCVAVATTSGPQEGGGGGVEEVGLVALHEVLHLAGITTHTTEQDGRTFDPFVDTPQCPAAAADTDHDQVVDAAECAALGADNLMFWAQGGSALTREQSWRVRWHPLFRP